MPLLRCVYVDDRNVLEPKFSPWVEHHRVQCVEDVFEVSSRCPGPHLILADVNMEDAESEQGRLEWGRIQMPLYGLTLALPFLGRPGPTAFETYTSYISQASTDGHALVGLTLIRSFVDGRGYSLKKMIGELRGDEVSDRYLTGTIDSALERALEAFRARLGDLAAFGSLGLMEIRSLRARLETLADASDFPLKVPFEDDTGPLRVQWTERGALQSFDLHSMFADTLGFEEPASKAVLGPMMDELEEWEDHSSDELGELSDVVVGLVGPYGEDSDEEPGGGPIGKRIDATAYVRGAAPEEQSRRRFQLRRLCMVFAWLQAWKRCVDGDITPAKRNGGRAGDPGRGKEPVQAPASREP